jgi:hypothetical protein
MQVDNLFACIQQLQVYYIALFTYVWGDQDQRLQGSVADSSLRQIASLVSPPLC